MTETTLMRVGGVRRSVAPPWFHALMQKHKRIAIAGGPKCGKTTLAATIDVGFMAIHGDDSIKLGWSESSQMLADYVNSQGEFWPLVVEGVQVPRALRKGMRVDCVIWLSHPHEALTKQQEAMAKGCGTVMREWLGDREMIPIEGVPGASYIEVK
jgi:hypothetical protein